LLLITVSHLVHSRS